MSDVKLALISAHAMFFSFAKNGPAAQRDIAVIYLSNPEIDPLDLSALMGDYFDQAPEPSQIWLLGSADLEAVLTAIAADRRLQERIPAVTRYIDSPDLLLATIERDGQLRLGDPEKDRALVDLKLRDRLMDQGMRTIFSQHDGLLAAGSGYHYVKPSGSHSKGFLRAANVLTGSTETTFAALAVYTRIGEAPIDLIYTDSSSINGVAYAVSDLVRRMGGSRPSPRVDSFGSYRGLDEGRFVTSSERTWVLISASTSGDLGRRIDEEFGVASYRQTTLFYVGETPIDSVICDLTRRDELPPNSELIDPIQSWSRTECPWCAHESTITLTGDQFLPANPVVTGHMLTSREVPTWLSSFMQSVFGTGMIRTHAHDGTPAQRTRSIVFTPGRLIDNKLGFDSRLGERLSRVIEKSVPAGTDWIIYLDDPDSKALATRVHGYLAGRGVRLEEDHLISARELTSPEFNRKLAGGVVLVVASVVVSGRSILTVSRALRSAHALQPIAYLVVVARMTQASELASLRSNLSYGDHHPNEHRVEVVDSAHLPYDPTSLWANESNRWREIRDRILGLEMDADERQRINDAISERLGVIESAPAGEGLGDQSFLPGFALDHTSEPLLLQPNFAFWPAWDFEKHVSGARPTQPEVFVTLAAVLNFLRSEKHGLSGSVFNEHNWRVIAPRNFSRFNDGVIQAAILRLAIGQELDFSTDDNFSSQMQETICSSVEHWHGADGRSAAEMLLALSDGRVRLTAKSERAVRVCLAALENLPPLMEALRLSLLETLAPIIAPAAE